MFNRNSKIFIVFFIIASFAIPTAHSVQKVNEHNFICHFDYSDHTNNHDTTDNGLIHLHCDKCFFNTDGHDFSIIHDLLISLEINKSILSAKDKLNYSNTHILFNTRSPPTV